LKEIEVSTPRGTGPNSICRSTTTASRTLNSKNHLVKGFNDSILAMKK